MIWITKMEIAVSMVLSYMFAISPQYFRNGKYTLDAALIFTAFAYFCFLIIGNTLVKFIIRNYYSASHFSIVPNAWKKVLESKHALYKIMLIILLCWLPILLALYPGSILHDTFVQMQQFINFIGNGRASSFNDHHPVFDTFLYGIIIVPVAKITGNWHLAVFIFVLLQAALASLSFSYTIIFSRKCLKLDENISFLLLLIYCLLPLYATSVQNLTKDTVFTFAYVLFCVSFLEIVKTRGAVFSIKSFSFRFLGICILCALTKKVGIYIILLSLFPLFVVGKKNKKVIMKLYGLLFLSMCILFPLFKSVIGVKPGGLQEMFSIPFQQTARYVKYYPKDVTNEERHILEKVLDMDNIAKKYNPICSDPIKGFSQKSASINYLKYVKVWGIHALRHPGVYIEAFNAMISGWFTFDPIVPIMDHSTFRSWSWKPDRDGITRSAAKVIQNTYRNIYKIPALDLLFSYGFYAMLFPCFLLSTVLQKMQNASHIKYWVSVFPTILSIVLGLWLAPGRFARYLYPLVYTMPLFLAWCLYIYKKEFVAKQY